MSVEQFIAQLPEAGRENLPANVQLFEKMTSEQAVAQRREWLDDQLRGEYDPAIGRVHRLNATANRLTREAMQQRDSGEIGYEAELAVHAKANAIKERAKRTFGYETVQAEYTCARALDQLQGPYPSMIFWGKESEKLITELTGNQIVLDDGIDLSKVPPAKNQEASEKDYIEYLESKKFVGLQTLDALRTDAPSLIAEIPSGETVTVPIANIVGAFSFDSWAGRGYEGQGQKVFEDANGVRQNQARSIDAIMDYAKRDTALPAVESINAYIQPDGTVVYGVQGNNHRVAAAIARGEQTIEVNSQIVFHELTKNVVPQASSE